MPYTDEQLQQAIANIRAQADAQNQGMAMSQPATAQANARDNNTDAARAKHLQGTLGNALSAAGGAKPTYDNRYKAGPEKAKKSPTANSWEGVNPAVYDQWNQANRRPAMHASVPSRDAAMPSGLPSPDQYQAQMAARSAPPMAPPPPSPMPAPPPPVMPPPNYAQMQQGGNDMLSDIQASYAAPSPLPPEARRMGMR